MHRHLLLLSLVLLLLMQGARMSAGAEKQPSALPGTEVPRQILVLYGYDVRLEDRKRMYPVDSLTASSLQAPLEWLGYELHYHDAGMEDLPEVADSVAAIICDGTLHMPNEKELVLADWLNAQRQKALPILFLGGVPFRDQLSTRRWQRDFGIGGDMEPVRQLKETRIREVVPDLFSREVPLHPREQDFIRLTAPPGSTMFLSLAGKDEVGGSHRFDPIFRAPWGFVWLAPYITFNASGTQRFYYVDPYKLIAQWLGSRVFPAPDTTTRMGRRLFFSHIDGDGFAMKSARIGQPTCGEIVRDNILRRYPFPVTVSIVESDIRGLAWSLEPKDAPKYEELARSVFALRNVEAASHSFSHPFYWDVNDPNPGEYASQYAPLNAAANYKTVDLKREITDSVRFIEERLLPPGKKVELMLWSGNCRPGVEALRLTRELGIENLNGGDTTVSELYPSIINIAPKLMQWGDELQIYAANQNEFMYSGGFAGPFYGGFAKVIDTFQRTELPRRMKPVNLYYHFYSGINISAERALKKILDWCWTQPLHHTTATEYARIVRASRDASVRQLAADRWLLRAGSHLQTWRLPLAAGLPLMEGSPGLLGFRIERDQVYLHTDGSGQAQVQLVPATQALAQSHLYVLESSGGVTFSDFGPNHATFSNSGSLPVKISFAGTGPNTRCEISVSGQQRAETQSISADTQGLLSLIVMEGKTVSMKLDRAVAGR